MVGEMLQGEAKISCMLEFPAFLLPTNLGQPIHSPKALTEHLSLNLAGTFFLHPRVDSVLRGNFSMSCVTISSGNSSTFWGDFNEGDDEIHEVAKILSSKILLNPFFILPVF